MSDPERIRAAYGSVAREYADGFSDELSHKPLDRELLRRFAETVGKGPVYDVGCGPGQTTAFLGQCGVDPYGVDLSPALVAEARRLHPDIAFAAGDMLALPLPDGAGAGVLAFYSIVHFSPEQLRRALAEMHRVLAPGGRLLLAFHAGDQVVHVEDFLGRRVALDFSFFPPEAVRAAVERAGFDDVDIVERDPYPDVEFPSRRAYLFARKSAWSVRRLDRVSDVEIEGLVGVLMDCVEGGASVSFMQPFTRERAEAFWRRVARDVEAGERVLLVAEDDQGICGTVQLALALPENQPHRADLAKMLVHRRARRRGLGAALMRAAERAALEREKTLLVLDAVTGGDAARLYERLGWVRVGDVPRFALYPEGGYCSTTYYYRDLAEG
jgi:SAM-dependent methyltransferase